MNNILKEAQEPQPTEFELTMERITRLQELKQEQADALNPPMEEPSEQEIAKQNRIPYLENEMRELSYDFDQDKAGIYQPNLEEKKALYRKDYNELCQLKGVVPKFNK